MLHILYLYTNKFIDPEYDAYKRGAFLEKTNRFNKDKPSDVPGTSVDLDVTFACAQVLDRSWSIRA